MNDRWNDIGWCDITRDGYRVGINSKNEIIGFPDVKLTVAPEMLLYLRADTDDQDNLAIIGQGHSKGDCWLYIFGEWSNIGFCGGQNCVEILGLAAGFNVYRQIAADKYVVHTFADDRETIVQHTMPWTSQGFLDVSGIGLALTDQARRIGDVMLPHSCGEYLVGQDVLDPPKMVLANRQGKRLKVLAIGNCNEPRATMTVIGEIAACSRSGNDGALLALGRYESFPDYIVTVPPIDNPVPNPDPEPSKMLDTLNSLRSKYGLTMSDDECVELCNDAAYIHRAEGYGVSKKEFGTRGRRYDGQECCHDVIMLKDGTYWDVLGAAGGASIPSWGNPSGKITDPNRGWIAPIPPKNGPIVPPVDPPPSGDLTARVVALETKTSTMENFLRATFKGF